MTDHRRVTLTTCQAACLHALTWDGADNTTIAQRTGLTLRAVDMNLSRAYQRLGVRSRAEAVAAVWSGRIVPVTEDVA